MKERKGTCPECGKRGASVTHTGRMRQHLDVRLAKGRHRGHWTWCTGTGQPPQEGSLIDIVLLTQKLRFSIATLGALTKSCVIENDRCVTHSCPLSEAAECFWETTFRQLKELGDQLDYAHRGT